MSHKKFYINSDGNGGFVISKQTLAVISFLIAVISFVGGVVFFSATARAELNDARSQIVDLKEEISVVKDNLVRVSVLETKLDNIQRDVADLRSDVKLLVNR